MMGHIVALALMLAAGPQPVSPEDLLVAVVYSPQGGAGERTVRADLEAIRRAGFNGIVPGGPDATRRVAGIAGTVGLRVGLMRRPGDGTQARITTGTGSRATADARLRLWEAIAAGVREIAFAAPGARVTPEILALGETAGIVTRNQSLFAPLRPRTVGVRSVSTGRSGPVSVRLLESGESLMIIAVSRGPAPRRVRITFAPDIPEAIWQNLETGTGVNFVLGAHGPVLDHTFAPRDSLVLTIGKRFR